MQNYTSLILHENAGMLTTSLQCLVITTTLHSKMKLEDDLFMSKCSSAFSFCCIYDFMTILYTGSLYI
jgi:hypothetical protein